MAGITGIPIVSYSTKINKGENCSKTQPRQHCPRAPSRTLKIGNAVYLKLEETGTKGANGTKKGDCTNLHNKRTGNGRTLRDKGRERVEGGDGKGH